MQRRAFNLLLGAITLLIVVVGPKTVLGHHVDNTNERLAKVGPTPDFELTAQDGRKFSISEVKGKVVAVSFTYTSCIDTCPLLTAKMVTIQKKLGSEFGSEVFFVTVSMDPAVDRPEILERYAMALGCDLGGWVFLTGTEAEIKKVARDYGVYRKKLADGDVDHTLLTSIVDRSGTVRVQYMGMRFDADEFLHDLKELVHEEDPA